MPVNAGEVQAVLTARDTQSAVVTALIERYATLKAQIAALGDVQGPTMDMLKTNLQAVETQLRSVQAAAQSAKSGLDDAGGSTSRAATEMDRMNGIATRLVERLLIFYAIKEAFTFTEALFTDAAALDALSKQTDLSLSKLQELKYGADQVDLPFNKATASIDHLDKALAELKPQTVDTLSTLGFSLNSIFSLNPDDRFDAIARAIAAMPSQLQRAKAEVALFGTDAVDPLIMRLGELEKAAHSAGAVMGDENVRQLAAADKAFKDTGDSLKIMAANFLVAGQNAVTFFSAPFFSDASIWQKLRIFANMANGGVMNPADLQLMGDLFGPGPSKDVQLPAEFGGKKPASGPQPNTPLFGEAALEQIREQSLAVKELTTQQEDEVRELMALDEFTQQNASLMGITTAQYREITKAAQERATAEREIEAEEKRWRAEQAAALLEVTRLTDQYNQITDAGGTAFDAQVAAIDRWAIDLEAKMQKAGTDTQEFYDALAKVWTAKLRSISMDTKLIQDTNTRDTKDGLQQIADKAFNTYQYALTQVGNWSDITIQKTRDAYIAAQKAADEWGGDNSSWIDLLVKKQQALQDAIDVTAAKQRAASGFYVDPSTMFVNPFIPGSTGYLPPSAMGTRDVKNVPVTTVSPVQPRAEGGPVSAGHPYLVNENTPNSEIFIPGTSGFISPRTAGMGGGITISPTMVFQSLVPSDPKSIEMLRQASDNAIVSSLRNLVKMGAA